MIESVITLLAFAFTMYLFLDNILRAHRKPRFDLRPNCLISRAPLLFIGGKKSLFYFLAPWGDLPGYLAEHGYEVYHLDLPAKTNNQRETRLQEFLGKQNQSFHLILNESHQFNLENLSYVMVDKNLIPEKSPSLIWRLHKWRTGQNLNIDLRQALRLSTHTKKNFDKILDQIIIVSEKDFLTTGVPHHDEPSSRPERDFLFSAELS